MNTCKEYSTSPTTDGGYGFGIESSSYDYDIRTLANSTQRERAMPEEIRNSKGKSPSLSSSTRQPANPALVRICQVSLTRRRLKYSSRHLPESPYPYVVVGMYSAKLLNEDSHRLPHSLDSVLPSPLPGHGLIPGAVRLVHMCDLGNERVVGVGVCEHRADAEKDCIAVSWECLAEVVAVHVPLLMVRAGLHWSRRMSKQILPLELMLGW